MFQAQLKELLKSFTAANRIRNSELAIDAYTDIIEEPLRNGKKTYNVAAILFLDDDKKAEVYYRRACAYEKLAQQTTNAAEKLEYYQNAATDMAEAIDIYDKRDNDIDEDWNKIDDARKKNKEYKNAITGVRQKLDTPVIKKKRDIEESSNETTSTTSGYQFRNIRMWTNPKIAYETRVAEMEEERLHPDKKSRR